MASSSGNSSGISAQIQNSGSDVGLIDQRKRKRMQSNRESARRSRQRKQRHMDNLIAQISQLKNENSQIITAMNISSQQCLQMVAENTVVRAQMAELSQRLESLTNILNCLNTSGGGGDGGCGCGCGCGCDGGGDGGCGGGNSGLFEDEDFQSIPESYMENNSWNLMYLNQPIMASPDLQFQY